MGLQMDTPMSELEGYMEEGIRDLEWGIYQRLSYLGVQCVNEATRQDKAGNWKDQTRHLRGSIGFVVVKDGKVYEDGKFGAGDSPTEAVAEGKEFARSLAREIPKGWGIVVVAGKDYATYVSAKGYDVLDGAEVLAETEVPKIIDKLGLKR